MLQKLTNDENTPLVWPAELRPLPLRSRLAWAASCVGRVAPLLSPSFRERSLLLRALTLTSNFADGMSFDPNEVTLVQGKIDAMCLACWGPEAEGTGTEAWAYREHYALQHLEVGASLLRALQHEQRSADECHLAVDSASLVFAIFHLWVQGCRASNEAVAYLEDRQLAFHALARNVFVAVTENDLPPSQASLQQIPLDTSVVALPASVLKKARKKFPLPKEEEAWLRATGKFLAPSSPKE